MEFTNFIKLLSRHKITLTIVPLVTVIVTYLLVKDLPVTYTSRARIATGIVDGSSAFLNGKDIREPNVNAEFDNILQTIMLKEVLSQVSYQLILHDLTEASPFTKPNKDINELSSTEKREIINFIEEKYQKKQELSETDDQEGKIYNLIASLNYDYKSLQGRLEAYRLELSDFLELQFESQNAELSAFVLNTLSKELINYYSIKTNRTKSTEVYFLDSLLNKKQDVLREKMENLRNYKVKNGILDVDGQAHTLIGQIADFEAKKQEAFKNITSYQGALKNIDNKFNPSERKYFESSVTKLNQDILATKNHLNAVNTNYIKSNFDTKYKAQLDSLQNILTSQVNNVNDSYSYSPSSTKQELVAQKLSMELSLELAKNSVASLDNELARLNGRLYKLVPDQASLQTLQSDLDFASKEYSEIAKRYETASMEASFVVKLRQVETAPPGSAQSSKKMIMVIFSGMLSFLLCVIVLFIIFYFDNSINTARELANKSGLAVIGILNKTEVTPFNVRRLWASSKSDEVEQYKSQMRSIRFEIDNELEDSTARIIAVTSLRQGEGKTFIALNLAHAYAMVHKKVLLIDGNFRNSCISRYKKPVGYLEDFLSEESTTLSVFNNADINVLANKGGSTSLFELNSQANLSAKLQSLKDQFDIIIIETRALQFLNEAKEWIFFADKIVPVFQAGQTIDNIQTEGIEFLKNLDSKVIGWIFNKAHSESKAKTIKEKGKKQKVEKSMLEV